MSGLDLALLRLMKHRDKFDRLITGLPEAGLEDTTLVLIKDFKAFFKEFPDVQSIDTAYFMTWFKEFRHTQFNDERHQMFSSVMKLVPEDIPKELEDGMMSRLLSAEFSHAMLTRIGEWDAGAEFDLLSTAGELLEDYERAMHRKVRTPFVEDTLESMLEEEEDDSGFHWRLDCLNGSLRPLRGGDFLVVAGRPDKGKTTFLTSELSYMVPQIAGIHGADSPRKVLWFNNEGPGKRIKQRYSQSLLGKSLPDMVDMLRAGTLTDALFAAAGGRNPHDVLRILDVHDYASHEIEAVLRHHPPALIVFDMIDNIRFSGLAGNGGTRTDQLLESMYQWGRNIAVKYDCPVIATSQISSAGDGLQFPTLPMLKDSQTGKQGAADTIITLGAMNDPSMEAYRWIGCTKNKLHRSGGRKDPRAEVLFEADIARYSNPEA